MESVGVLCTGVVDLITTEFHYPFFSKFIKDVKRFPTSDSFDSYFLNYKKMGGNGKCTSRPTEIQFRDSEHYKADEENPLQRTCPKYDPPSTH